MPSKNEVFGLGSVVDLDDVEISLLAYLAWQAMAEAGARALALVGVGPAQIPIEQGLVLETGELEIFVEVPEVTRISMKIPPNQWRFR